MQELQLRAAAASGSTTFHATIRTDLERLRAESTQRRVLVSTTGVRVREEAAELR